MRNSGIVHKCKKCPTTSDKPFPAGGLCDGLCDDCAKSACVAHDFQAFGQQMAELDEDDWDDEDEWEDDWDWDDDDGWDGEGEEF